MPAIVGVRERQHLPMSGSSSGNMAWRNVLESVVRGRLTNSDPGRVTGWMQLGNGALVTMDFRGDFDEDIPTMDFLFMGEGQYDESYMQPFCLEQVGEGFRAGFLRGTSFPEGGIRVQWSSDCNGNVIMDVGDVVPLDESDRYEVQGAGWSGAGALVLPIALDTGNVLLQFRSAVVSEPGTWGLFGGRRKVGSDGSIENAEHAVAREFFEETGYRGNLFLSRYMLRFSRMLRIDTQYYIGVVPRQFIPVLNWESAGYDWMRPVDFRIQSSSHPALDYVSGWHTVEDVRGIRKAWKRHLREIAPGLYQLGRKGRVFRLYTAGMFR